MAGIGCHYMAVWMDRSTVTFTQMGGEGVPWVGQAPFTTDQHIFANLGDGTYFHCGLLAIRQSIAAGVNITYKILFNDAVAMTGGQPVGRPELRGAADDARAGGRGREAHRRRDRRAREVRRRADRLAPGVTVHHRDELDAIQRELREIAGCTVIIYDQTCATEKRRRRKRGTLVEPAKRVVINELVCEGCGDCSVQSNCLSRRAGRDRVRPQAPHQPEHLQQGLLLREGLLPELRHGRGRAAEVGARRPGRAARPVRAAARCPSRCCRSAETAWGIVVAGVGGTGVITIGQLLGMAAHLEGKGIVTQDAAGLAQKGGATWSHIQIADRMDAICTTKVGTAEADLVIGCDPIVGANKATLAVMREGRTLRGAQHPRHADRRLREQPRLAVPGGELRSGDRRGRRCRRTWARSTPTSSRCSCWATRSTPTR